MSDFAPKTHLRYPFHAVVLVAAAWLFYAVVLLVSALLLLPCVPLAPVLVMLMIALGGLLSSAHEYARSVAQPRARGRLAARRDAKVSQSSPTPLST
jgi:hypothetical protein